MDKRIYSIKVEKLEGKRLFRKPGHVGRTNLEGTFEVGVRYKNWIDRA